MKEADYYRCERNELTRYVPENAVHILDVGCGGGGLGRSLLKINSDRKMYGIELMEEPATIAREAYTEVIVGPVDEIELPWEKNFFDVIIFADVLEHLVDPWSVLNRLKEYLNDDGIILCSIPNVAHWSNLKGVLGGSWMYQEAGILDKTHLRFFTRLSVLELLRKAGLKVEQFTGTLAGTNIIDTPEFRAGLKSFGINADQTINDSHIFQFITVCKKQSFQKKVSVIVWGDSSQDETSQCLQAIQESSPKLLEEIILLTEGKAPAVIPDGVKVVQVDAKEGFSQKIINGIDQAKEEMVCIIRNNILLPKDSLERLLDPFGAESKIAAVGPFLNGETGMQELSGIDIKDRDGLETLNDSIFYQNNFDMSEMEALNPSCLMLQKEAYKNVGKFNTALKNERTAMGSFSRALREQGYKLKLVQDCLAYRLPFTE